MGVLTAFRLVEQDLVDFAKVEGGPIEWLEFTDGAPETFGLPPGYVSRSYGIDKSWDEWQAVLLAYGWLEVADVLFEFPEEVDNPWGTWIRYLPGGSGEDNDIVRLRDWLVKFDPEAATKAALEAEATDYDGNVMDGFDLEYVVSYIARFGKWLVAEYRPGDALLIASS